MAIPLWLAVYAGRTGLPSALAPLVWHVHEMVFGFGAATVAGFLLTAIPNWTGRMPLQGGPLAILVTFWAVGRLGVLSSAAIGPLPAAFVDLAFPAVFLAVVAREILAGKNWRNLPMLVALSLRLLSTLFVHLEALGLSDTAELGNRLGIATLLLLISLVGGRIIPSFTRNWLVKMRPGVTLPVPEGRFDRATLAATALGLVVWALLPESPAASWAEVVAGSAVTLRLLRWRDSRTISEPLLLILHIGYGWLAIGLLLAGLDELFGFLPRTAALHALTVGAIGTMTLAVMTRASLGHTGRPLSAGRGTRTIYILITIAAVLRVVSPFAGNDTMLLLSVAGAAWSGAFGLFAILYGPPLARPRAEAGAAMPI